MNGPGRIRIIAGRLRNSKLDVPVRAGLRPTPDRLRETLFNWLAPYLPGACCLDLFAGTGALGIEALSRGAGEAVLVERDPLLAAAITANLTRLRENASVVNAAAAEYLKSTARAFDLVFIDPPFDLDLWTASLRMLQEGSWLSPNALIYMESPAASPARPGGQWACLRETHAAAVHGALYRQSAALG